MDNKPAKQKYVLLERTDEFDFFACGRSIFIGILENGIPKIMKEIGFLGGSMDREFFYDSQKVNAFRKKVASFRNINPIEVFDLQDFKKKKVAGYRWEYGNIDALDEEGNYISSYYLVEYDSKDENIYNSLKALSEEINSLQKKEKIMREELLKKRFSIKEKLKGIIVDEDGN